MYSEKPKKGQAWDVAIIGSGPAALTAAIYTTRGAASSLVIGGYQWGGQLMLTTEVDNYPGFENGIQGPELMQKMRTQAERFGAEFIQKDVASLDLSNRPFRLKTGDEEYLANSILVGTGAETKWLGVPGEDKLRGRGVSSCAPCDAPFFKDKIVAVVGGGDSAMEEALVLTKYAPKVYMIHRRESFKASQAMQQRVLENEKIEIIWDSEVVELMGEKLLEKVKIKTAKQSKSIDKVKSAHYFGEQVDPPVGEARDDGFIYWQLKVDGVFVAIGHRPATEIFSGQIELDEKAYVKRSANQRFNMSTNVDGVFVAGDVHDHDYRQAVTAAGFGCMAGMEILRYLDKSTPNW